MDSRTAPFSRVLRVFSAGVVVAVFFVGRSAVLAQQPAAPPSTPSPVVMSPGTQLLLQRFQAGLTVERYLDNLRMDFFQLDADGDGKIAQRDVDLHGLMESIQLRTVALTVVMRYDLDGDGVVTEDEIRRTMRYDLRAQLASAALNAAGPGFSPANAAEKQVDDTVRSIMALDADKDGKVSLAEAAKFTLPGLQRGASLGGQSARARQALTLDSSSKGELTLADYQAAGEALFRKVDADGDGTVSQQELADYRRQPGPPKAPDAAALEAIKKRQLEQADAARKKEQAARAGCEMPMASENAKVVLLSGYQTDALSSVTLGSQDAVVHAGRVVVEPGNEPLYVVISTYSPTIWQFSGAVERIERLVMTSALTGPSRGDSQQSPLAGATGVAQERITFFARSNCMAYFTEAPSGASVQTVATIRNATGKAPEVFAAKYSVSGYNIPSGRIEAVQEQQRAGLIIQKAEGKLNIIGDASNVIIQTGPSKARDEMVRFFPGGVTTIDPKTVIGSAPAAAYEVLPSQAGLMQLLSSGALTENRAGEYIVRQKIRFPPGLAGAHAVTFLIMKGTPYPDGDPAHSCVIVEDTGESKGATCRTR